MNNVEIVHVARAETKKDNPFGQETCIQFKRNKNNKTQNKNLYAYNIYD